MYNGIDCASFILNHNRNDLGGIHKNNNGLIGDGSF